MITPGEAQAAKVLIAVLSAAVHVCAVAPVSAQGRAALIEDVNQTATSNPSSTPRFTSRGISGSIAAFSAIEPSTGRELWWRDPVSGTTDLVKDIRVGSDGADPQEFVELFGLVYFSASDGVHGRELWCTDGTVAGTRMVTDLVPGNGGSNPVGLTILGARVYFAATAPGFGRELFASDGTAAGTVCVVDIRPGNADSNPSGIAVGGGIARAIAFSAAIPAVGREPWISDGTAAGTFMLADVNPGSDPSHPADFTFGGPFGAWVAFSADDGQLGREPWISDGTSGGTVMLADVQTGAIGSDPSGFLLSAPFDPPGLWFAADDGTHGRELWSSDGTTQNTALLVDVQSGSVGSAPRYLTSTSPLGGGMIVFVADDGVAGAEPWCSDGTEGGTALLLDVRPGSQGSRSDGFRRAGPYGGPELFFAAADGTAGLEPWSTDGTASNTARIADLHPNNNSVAGCDNLLPLGGGKVLIAAIDGTHGTELWCGDARASTATMVGDLNPPQPSSSPALPAVRDPLHPARVLVAWDDGNFGNELWSYHSATHVRMLVADIKVGAGSSAPQQLTRFGDGVLFTADSVSPGRELWATDGTTGGTAMILDIRPGGQSSNVQNLTVDADNQVAYFSANNLTNGIELWSTDGTPAGTRMLADINPGSGHSRPFHLTVFDGVLYFTAVAPNLGRELWKSDGTPGGTVLVKDLRPGNQGAFDGRTWVPPGVAPTVGGELLFQARVNNTIGFELYITDGTDQGTRLFTDLSGGSSIPVFLQGSPRDGWYLAATSQTAGRELWFLDANTQAITLVEDIVPGTGSSDPLGLPGHRLGGRQARDDDDRLFFSATTSTSGRELWVSDGTAGGTDQVADVWPGDGSGIPDDGSAWIARLPGSSTVLFLANDGSTGYEVWRSDGTAAGTELHANIGAGARNGNPGQPVLAGSDWLFPCTDGTRGRELYRARTMAGSLTFGEGCAGSAGTPRAFPITAPELGSSTFGFGVRGGPALAPAAVLLAASSVEIPFGTCTLLVAPIVSTETVFLDANGVGRWLLPVPDQSNLIGVRLYAQFVVVDPGGTPPGLSFSDGLMTLVSSGNPNQYD